MNRHDQILEAIFCSWVKTLHPAYNIYANYTSSRNGGPNCYVLYLRPWNNKIFSQNKADRANLHLNKKKNKIN